jgi:hypothetical protein
MERARVRAYDIERRHRLENISRVSREPVREEILIRVVPVHAFA